LRTINWQNNPAEFNAWTQGETGYPIIDAGMRQLREIGWMHNRARMITASFLVKDLLIDWRWGERWYMQQLLDGDPAANNGGWQWTAGTGTDAAPYFRIFNPILQSKKFDPEGQYIRRWVPELSILPDKLIHTPWEMNQDQQRQFNIEIGVDYPQPIIEHSFARQRALDVYKLAKVSAS
jgi:deoxyribodipyrimidine photo-lyase